MSILSLGKLFHEFTQKGKFKNLLNSILLFISMYVCIYKCTKLTLYGFLITIVGLRGFYNINHFSFMVRFGWWWGILGVNVSISTTNMRYITSLQLRYLRFLKRTSQPEIQNQPVNNHNFERRIEVLECLVYNEKMVMY